MKNQHCFIPRSCCLIVCGVVVLGAIQPCSAIEPSVVVPNSTTNIEGNLNNSFPFNISPQWATMRYQQLYDASQFANFSAGGFITQIIFRPDSEYGEAFSSTLPNVQINLSTTSVADDQLSLTFADNIGPDDTVVFSGALPLSSANSGGIPRDFDIVINLTTPFFYDPSAGNLLLDVHNFGGGTSTAFDAEDTNHDGVSRVTTNSTDGVNQPRADLGDSYGLVTGFTISASGLVLTNAASELGGFAVALPGIECRGDGSGRYAIVFTFNQNITSVGGADTTCGDVTQWSIDSADPHRVIVDLRNVFHACNGSELTVHVTDVNDDQGNNLAHATTGMTLLLGDVTADGVVDHVDVHEVHAHKGQPTDETNFRDDVDVNGFISIRDVRLVRSQIGTEP